MDHATSFNEPNADMVDNIATGHGQVTLQLTSREKPSEEGRKVEDSEETFPKFDDMPFWQVGVILASLGLALSMFAIDETIVATSVATIGSAVNTTGSLTWIGTSYLLTTTVVQPILGRVADAVGTKRLLIVDLWIFVVGNIIAGTANTLNQIVAGRLIAGVGGAGLISLSCILISQLTHERQRSSYMNLVNLVFLLGDSLGPTIGGAFANSGNWRWIFLFTAPSGPIITVFLFRTLQIPRAPSHITSFREALRKVDLIGMFMLVACLSFIVVALNLGGTAFAWNSPTLIAMFTASGVSFALFIVAEKYAALPIAPLYLFSQWEWRNVPIMTITRCLLFFHVFAMTFYLPVFLQVIGLSSTASAALIIPFLVTAGISGTITNSVAHKYGHARPLFMSSLALLPVGMGIMSTLNETSSIGRIVGYSLLTGLAFGSGTQISMVIAQIGLPADVLPTVTALVGTSPTLGGTFGVGVIGTIINNEFRRSLSKSSAILSTADMNLNDVVKLIHESAPGPAQEAIIKAYVSAWRVGCLSLAGIAVAQFILCLLTRPVEFQEVERQQTTSREKESPTNTV